MLGIPDRGTKSKLSDFVRSVFGEKTFVFEKLKQNAAAESFKNSVRKDNF
jgi:hypothetical protein